jgi:regulatory protein
VPRPTGAARVEARKARLERHAAETNQDVVMNAAARFLEVRARSVAEVRRHLLSARYPEPLVDSVLARLTEIGYLNDATFAQAWVEARDRSRPRGEQVLRRELALKGLDREVIAATISNRAESSVDETSGSPADPDAAAATRLLAKRRMSLERVSDPAQRRNRAYSLLARSGFSPDVCREATRAFLADADAYDDPGAGYGPDAGEI